jgi:small subunit ribosomal protein S6
MRKYETLIIFDPEIEEKEIEEKIDVFKDKVEKDGKILSIDKWGIRELAYPIDNKKRGYYVLIEFLFNKDLIFELNRDFNLSKEIMRHCIVRKEGEDGRI